MFEKASQSLKYDLNFVLVRKHIYGQQHQSLYPAHLRAQVITCSQFYLFAIFKLTLTPCCFSYHWCMDFKLHILLEKYMFPIPRLASSFLVFFCMYVKRLELKKKKSRGEMEQQQTYQFTQGYNILHRLQVYQHYIYIHTYIL